jgi:hypothetical protein
VDPPEEGLQRRSDVSHACHHAGHTQGRCLSPLAFIGRQEPGVHGDEQRHTEGKAGEHVPQPPALVLQDEERSGGSDHDEHVEHRFIVREQTAGHHGAEQHSVAPGGLPRSVHETVEDQHQEQTEQGEEFVVASPHRDGHYGMADDPQSRDQGCLKRTVQRPSRECEQDQPRDEHKERVE